MKAKCCASPDIICRSSQACGPCEREKVQQRVNLELAAVEARFPSLGWIVPEEVETARSQAEQQVWIQSRGLPDSTFKVKKLPKPERGWSTISAPKGSLLRTEVKPDDIVDQFVDEWGGALSLSDEIANIEAQRAADGMPPLAPTISVFEDDYEWDDVTELGVSEDATQTEEQPFSITPTNLEVLAGQDTTDNEFEKPAFVPPHRKRYQRLREGAKQALHDTTSTNSKLLASEAANLARCCAMPLM